MADNSNTLGRINARNVFYDTKMLIATEKALVFQKFGGKAIIDKNKGDSVTFTEMPPHGIITSVSPLKEGVTKAPLNMSRREVVAQIIQLGNYLVYTDVMSSIMEDGNTRLKEDQRKFLSYYQKDERDFLAFNTLRQGTTVQYSGTATSRGTVIAPITRGTLLNVSRTLSNGRTTDSSGGARPITEFFKPGVQFGTVGCEPAYVVICHPDLKADLRNIPGFVTCENYGSSSKLDPMEFGKVDDFRFICTKSATPWTGEGATVTTQNVKKTSNKADVYPMIVLGADAFKLVHLSGKESAALIHKPLGSGGSADPLDQRGTVGYKHWFTCAIVFQEYMARIEAAATDVLV